MLPRTLGAFFVVGYLLTVLIETPIVASLLARHHRPRDRWTAAAILTAATYPIVVLVLPPLLLPRIGYAGYVLVAEVFAAAAEAWLLAFWCRRSVSRRDRVVVIVANVVSFAAGVVLQ